MGFSRKRQSILVGLAKICATLAPNMQFYFYIIDMKVMGAKWSRALALLLCKEERGPFCKIFEITRKNKLYFNR
jgi:hypothetical protein